MKSVRNPFESVVGRGPGSEPESSREPRPGPNPGSAPGPNPGSTPESTPGSRREADPGASLAPSRRLPLLETAALVLLLVVGLLTTVAFARLAQQPSVYGAMPSAVATPAGQSPALPSADAADTLTTRGLALLQTQTAGAAVAPGTTWSALLRTQADALGLFLQRLATSPAYARQDKDDAAFAADFWTLLQAAPAAPATLAALAATQPPLAPDQSRIAWLAQALTAASYAVPGEWQASGLTATQGAATLGLLALKPETPRDGAVIFGRRPLGGTIQLASSNSQSSGTAASGTTTSGTSSSGFLLFRTFLQVDGRTAAATDTARIGATPAGFELPLDVRNSQTGLYRTEIFALASDGRSRHADLGQLEVPLIDQLSAGAVMNFSLPALDNPSQSAGASARYVAIYPQDTQNGWRYALTVANPDAPVAAELFNLSGGRIAFCDNPDTRWEGLRALLPASPTIPEADRVAYARVGRTRADGEAAAATVGNGAAGSGDAATAAALEFTLVQSDRTATPTGNPDQVLAVLAQNDSQVVVQDKAGNRSTRPVTELDLAEFAGRLSQLTLTTAQGAVSFYPDFDAETDTFGLYLPAGSGPLTIRASAREGSFASLTAAMQPGTEPAATDNGPTASDGVLTATLAPPAAESTLALTVSNGDGETRIYRVHVLQATQPGGYQAVLEAFPESYRSPLYLLHVQHPAYRFVADPVNVSFDEFVTAETVRDRSLVDAAVAAASWVKPGSPVYDGKSWKAAAPVVVAHFADPRNFLNERDIFQFELLRFQAGVHDSRGVASMLVGTFMAPDSSKNPDRIDYARLLVDAGQTADISPLLLAARIVQEMGRDGTSPLAFGKLPGYEGVYNFYNIGATPNPTVTNGAQINAARYALFGLKPDEGVITPDEAVYQLPWKTPASAITGGAIWIAQRYTAIGQDTLYLQKFDLAAADGLYTHQYAQNIQMAWAEGRRTQSAYRTAGLADQAFTFRIPTFLSIPALRSPLPVAAGQRLR